MDITRAGKLAELVQNEGYTLGSVVRYGFLSVIIVLIAVTAIGMLRLQGSTAGMDVVVEQRDEQIMLMQTMRHAINDRNTQLQAAFLTNDPLMIDVHTEAMSRATTSYLTARKKLLSHKFEDGEYDLLISQHDHILKAVLNQNRAMSLLLNGQQEESRQLIHNFVLPEQQEALLLIDRFISLKRSANHRDLNNTKKEMDFTYGLMITLSSVGVALSLLIAHLVSSRISQEIVKREETENSLRHSEMRERTIRENIVDGVITLDSSGNILSCNRACKAIFLCDGGEMIGQSAHFLLPDTVNPHLPLDLSRHLSLWEKMHSGTSHEVTGRRKDNSEFPAEIDVSRVEIEGETAYIVVLRDITGKKAAERQLKNFNRELEEKVTQRTEELAATNDLLRAEIEEKVRAQRELTHLARHDSLTQLPNRAYFTEQLERTIYRAERHNRMFAILFMDLDGFKQVNDTHGHAIGDKLLIEVGQRLSSAVRREDIVARMGGDEFTVILNEIASHSAATQIAENIISSINQVVACNGTPCHVGISIGIAFYPHHGTDADTLIRHADDAMYAAKAAGKNCYHHSSIELEVCDGQFPLFRQSDG